MNIIKLGLKWKSRINISFIKIYIFSIILKQDSNWYNKHDAWKFANFNRYLTLVKIRGIMNCFSDVTCQRLAVGAMYSGTNACISYACIRRTHTCIPPRRRTAAQKCPNGHTSNVCPEMPARVQRDVYTYSKIRLKKKKKVIKNIKSRRRKTKSNWTCLIEYTNYKLLYNVSLHFFIFYQINISFRE